MRSIAYCRVKAGSGNWNGYTRKDAIRNAFFMTIFCHAKRLTYLASN